MTGKRLWATFSSLSSRGWRVSQPRRSPATKQRIGGRWGLLRSGAAHPKLLFYRTTEAAYCNYSSCPIAMTEPGDRFFLDESINANQYPITWFELTTGTRRRRRFPRHKRHACPSKISLIVWTFHLAHTRHSLRKNECL